VSRRRRDTWSESCALSPLAVRFIRALRAQGPSGHAETLRACIEFASIDVLANGVFPSHETDQYLAVERIARQHLEWNAAKRAYRKALANVPTFAERDAIETAAAWRSSVSDDAHYYLGVAVGIIAASLTER
jgi:hypothetical protein